MLTFLRLLIGSLLFFSVSVSGSGSDSDAGDDDADDVSVSSSLATKSDVTASKSCDTANADDAVTGDTSAAATEAAAAETAATFDRLLQVDAQNKDFDILQRLDVDDVDVDSESLEPEIDESDKIPFIGKHACVTIYVFC